MRFFRTPNAHQQRVAQKNGMVKVAQNFFPAHGFDQNTMQGPSQHITDKLQWSNMGQRSLVDYVLNNSSAPTASGDGVMYFNVSPLLEQIMKSNGFHQVTAEEDKSLLFKAWDSASIIQDSSNAPEKVFRISNLSDNELNRLKAQGLLKGAGHDVSLTDKGHEILVKLMLDNSSSLSKTSRCLKNIIQTCSTQNTPALEFPSPNQGEKIVRDNNGKWRIIKEWNED